MAKFLDINGLSELWGKITQKFQKKISVSGILKGDGAGGVTAAVPGTDYLKTAPVTSVNGKTGAVSLTAADVGALPNTTKIPTKTSDITNDSGYITAADVPTKVSELDNDAGYITDAALTPYAKTADIPTKTSQLTNDSNFATTSQVNAKYTKPSTGIPETDLSAGVQDSLAKADSALQSAPVTSVAGKTGAVSLTKSDVGLGSVDNVSVNARLNRTTNVNAADTNYSTYMARGEALFSSETTPTVNGCIAWQFE